MQEERNIVYLSKAGLRAEEAEPDAIGIILIWANQMIVEGRMPDHVQAAFRDHFSFFAD